MSDTEINNDAGGGSDSNNSAATAADTTNIGADAGTNSNADASAAATGENGDKAADTGGEKTPDFVLPEAYKDKPWAAKVKSTEDLYKQIDNLTTLAGKKHAYPTADATPEQLTEYYAGLRPESADAYDFGKDHPNPEIAKQFGEMLFKSNISAHQSKQLIADYQAFEKATIEQATSADGFKAEMTKQFGEKYDATVASVSKSLEKYASKEEQAVINAMPNQYLGAVYKIMDGILKAHGANEGGDNLHNQKGGSLTNSVSIDTQRSEIRAEIRNLELRPHTAAEKQALVDKLQATYKQK